jgi:hypothetical protein
MAPEAIDYGTQASSYQRYGSWLFVVASIALGVFSIIGGWVYIFSHKDSGRLFEEGGWQWFAAHFPYRTVRILALIALIFGTLGLPSRRRLAFVGIALGALGLIWPHRW